MTEFANAIEVSKYIPEGIIPTMLPAVLEMVSEALSHQSWM